MLAFLCVQTKPLTRVSQLKQSIDDTPLRNVPTPPSALPLDLPVVAVSRTARGPRARSRPGGPRRVGTLAQLPRSRGGHGDRRHA